MSPEETAVPNIWNQMNWHRIRRGLLIAFSGLFFISCSSYPKEFEQASSAYFSDEEKGLEGPWIGSWTSIPTGHEGPLWCLVEPVPQDDSKLKRYRFRYRAGWGWILRGEFEHEVSVEASGERSRFEEEMDLGKLGGVYLSETEVADGLWRGRHRSTKGDRGEIMMKRPSRLLP